MIKKYILVTISAILLSLVKVTTVMAHPGHGSSDGHSLIHFLTEPVHVLSFIATVVACAAIVLWFRARKKKMVHVDA